MKTTDVVYAVKKSRLGGKGLFANKQIKRGEFIIEYIGKRLTTKEADVSKSRYLFEIDEDCTLDGPTKINTAGYINHGCNPNCESDVLDGHVLISAIKDIKKGDEFTFDYGQEYFDEFIKPVGCKCNAKKHRK